MQHVVDYVFILLASERWFTAKHNKHNYTHGPYIALRGITSLEHFWSNIIRRSIRLIHHLVRVDTLGQPKINQLDMTVVILLVKQEVLRLDIPVTNTICMQVAQRIKSLLHDRGRLLLGQVLFLRNMVKQFASFAKPIGIISY